jgi:hypothetical protein
MRDRIFGIMPRAIAYGIVFAATVIFIGVVALALIRHSEYEKRIRIRIAKTMNALLSYNKYTGNTISAVRQSVIVDDALIAMSSKLVYEDGEVIEVFYRSSSAVKIRVIVFSNNRQHVIKEVTPKHTRRNGAVVMDTFNGFKEEDFDKAEIRTIGYNGWIQIEVSNDNKTSNIPVFSEGPKTTKVLFVESTDTMKAYVSANGLHTFYGPRFGELLGTFTRPSHYPVNYKLSHFKATSAKNEMDCNDHLANANFVLKQALDNLSLKYDTSSDEYLEKDNNLEQYKLIILGAHNEYWTTNKVRVMERYLKKGGSLMILGANTAYRYVAAAGNYDIIWGDGFTNSPYESIITNYLGTYYDSRGYDTYAPFKLTKYGATSDLVGGANEGDVFGVGTDFVSCSHKIKGASGHETDKLSSKSNGFNVIATGLNPGGGGADIVYKKLESGGHILNFGSISLWHKMSDPIVANIISKFTSLATNQRK